jgi:HK97 gp10 family phage protein
VIDVDESVRAIEDDLRQRLPAAAEQAAQAVRQAYINEGHVRSGEMVRSVTTWVDPQGLRFKVIVGDFVSAFLEFGTKHQPARYVVTRAMHANMANTIAILEPSNGI